MAHPAGDDSSLTLQGPTRFNEAPDKAEHCHVDDFPHLENPLEAQRDPFAYGTTAACIYSTLMSGLFLGVAIAQPEWGSVISSRGLFTPTSVNVITNILAKTIEVLFATMYVTFLGQFASRRAARQDRVTLSVVTMRSWISQPGALIIHYKDALKASRSALGILSIVATILALLYTTAAGALVQPQLRSPPWHTQELSGPFFNNHTGCTGLHPELQGLMDNDDQWTYESCSQYRLRMSCSDYLIKYLAGWSDLPLQSNSSSIDTENRRPIPVTLSNVTANTAWVGQANIEEDSERFGRIVNNMTVAIPHVGLPSAAQDPRNGLVHPEDLANARSYSVKASLVTIISNALCVNANVDELKPLLSGTLNETKDLWAIRNNHTALDDIFQWRDRIENDTVLWDEETMYGRPGFKDLPEAGSTEISNAAGRSTAYIVGQKAVDNDDMYYLCSLRIEVSPSCLTHFNSSSVGQYLEVACDETPALIPNSTQYTLGDSFLAANLFKLLGLGASDDENDMSYLTRITSMLQLSEARYNDSLPTPAEFLLGMSTCLVSNSIGSSLYVLPPADYNETEADEQDQSMYQRFNASVTVTQYISGGQAPYEKGFFVVLALVFTINLCILIYLGGILRVRLIVDVCEPPVLFLLGYHSSPNKLFRPLTHDGLQTDDLVVPWVLKRQRGQVVVVAGDGEGEQGWVERSKALLGFGLRRRRPSLERLNAE